MHACMRAYVVHPQLMEPDKWGEQTEGTGPCETGRFYLLYLLYLLYLFYLLYLLYSAYDGEEEAKLLVRQRAVG